MSTRRESREWVVQILFQLDVNPSDDLVPVFDSFWSDRKPGSKSKRFTEELVRGVRENMEQIDTSIRDLAMHWDIERMGVLDRNVLRLAIYEMLFRDDIPPVVSINEAVDIAKYFSNRESGKFVNGILDHVRRNLDRPSRTAEAESE